MRERDEIDPPAGDAVVQPHRPGHGHVRMIVSHDARSETQAVRLKNGQDPRQYQHEHCGAVNEMNIDKTRLRTPDNRAVKVGRDDDAPRGPSLP